MSEDVPLSNWLSARDGLVHEAVHNATSQLTWDNCMSKTWCKWPVFAGIAVASLIIFSLLFCCIRCLCCGMECCCGCLSCCNRCCPSPRGGRRRKGGYDDGPGLAQYSSANPNAAQYKSHPPPEYRSAISTPSSAPQFATFDVSKPRASANPDALPAMPSWETASERRVEVFDDPSDNVEMKTLSPNVHSPPTPAESHQGLLSQPATPGGLRADMGSRMASNNTYGLGVTPVEERNSYLSSYSHSTAGQGQHGLQSPGLASNYGNGASRNYMDDKSSHTYSQQEPLSPYGVHSPYDDLKGTSPVHERDPYHSSQHQQQQSPYGSARPQYAPQYGDEQSYRSEPQHQTSPLYGHDRQHQRSPQPRDDFGARRDDTGSDYFSHGRAGATSPHAQGYGDDPYHQSNNRHDYDGTNNHHSGGGHRGGAQQNPYAEYDDRYGAPTPRSDYSGTTPGRQSQPDAGGYGRGGGGGGGGGGYWYGQAPQSSPHPHPDPYGTNWNSGHGGHGMQGARF